MSPLEIIRQLASQVRHVNPSALSRPQKQEYVDMARKVYTPRFLEAQRKEEKWRELAAKTTDPVQRTKYLEAARNAEYEAARFSKLDQAAGSIGKVNKYDDEFRALTLPGHESGIPGGIATYYPPGHTPDDAMLADSTYLELLGTSPDVKGAGRVLLRQTGMTFPSNPMTWHSTSYPETMGFYESRGAELIPKDRLPKDSAMYGNLPVFRVPRGDVLKEKEGGPVSKPRGWSDFITAPGKASSQLHVSERDVQRGEQLDLARRQAEPTYPSIENAERLPSSRRAEQDDALFREALLRGPDTSMTASPSRSAQIARAALGGAGSFGGWTRDPIEEPTPEMLARFTGEMLSDPLNAVGLGALKFLGRSVKKLMPAVVGFGTSAYASDAEAKREQLKKQLSYSGVIRGADGGAIKDYAGGGLVKGLKMLFPNAAAPMHVVKPKGGNWLTGSVEGALGGLKKPQPTRAWNPTEPMDPMNQWIEGPLTKYVKTRMASPEDEVRRLAEEGVLHFEPNVVNTTTVAGRLHDKRTAAGFPGYGMGKNPQARGWEELTDEVVFPDTYANHAGFYKGLPPEQALQKVGGDFAAKNPEVMANRLDMREDLGFDHLVDELSNALDPNSGLPRHLQLTPEAVKNMSMEKAVRRVADINAWRAQQQAVVTKELADKASVVREYAPTEQLPNPKGLRWVELKANEVKQNADLSVDDVERMTREERQNLEKQLKYEGDTMGHCVGGYCDDVASGRSRIFSLRDAKGEPHVTVEVAPRKSDPHNTDAEAYTRISEEADAKFPPDEHGTEAHQKYINDALNALHSDKAWGITQIKGKQNRKPNDEYLPFVQDFVRNNPLGGAWGEVGDLENAGLRRVVDTFNSNELKKIQEAGIEIPRWTTPEEIKQIGAKVWPELYPDVNGFASGGAVQSQHNPWSMACKI